MPEPEAGSMRGYEIIITFMTRALGRYRSPQSAAEHAEQLLGEGNPFAHSWNKQIAVLDAETRQPAPGLDAGIPGDGDPELERLAEAAGKLGAGETAGIVRSLLRAALAFQRTGNPAALAYLAADITGSLQARDR